MSRPAARLTDNHVCPMVSGVVPHVGGPILFPGEPRVLINGLPAARVGDFAFCAGGPDTIALGSFTVLIGGKPAARMGDLTVHGGTIVMGSPNVMIGDSGGGAGSPPGFTMAGARARGAAFTQTSCAAQGAKAAAAGDPLAAEPRVGGPTASWIEIDLVDDDGNPVPFIRYRVTPPDGKPREGFLDQQGFARVDGIDPGTCRITFPDLDGRSWTPEGGGAPGRLQTVDPGLLPNIQPPSVVLRPRPVPPPPPPPPLPPPPGPTRRALIREDPRPMPVAFYSQNMALFPNNAPVPLFGVFVRLYQGQDRERAKEALRRLLRESRPDVVGLSEMWVSSEREGLASDLRDIYPHFADGPDRFIDPMASGVMLLSRFPIEQTTRTVYRDSVGWDGLTAKGVLHARIRPPGAPCAIDYFLTHTQSPFAEGTDDFAPDRVGPLRRQLRHLAAFVWSCRDPACPAIVTGDLNVPGNLVAPELATKQQLHAALMGDLGQPDDLWLAVGKPQAFPAGTGAVDDGGQGITNDPKRAFEERDPHTARTLADLQRRQGGFRLDYFLSLPGTLFRPTHADMQVVLWEQAPNVDMSDHYGVHARQTAVLEGIYDLSFPIQRVSVRMTRFKCLNVTGSNPIAESNDDEVRFHLRCRTEREPERAISTPAFEGVQDGTERPISTPALEFGDPGAFLEISVRGEELGGIFGDTDLGTSTVTVSRAELLSLLDRPLTRGVPLLTGADGEYAVAVELVVE